MTIDELLSTTRSVRRRLDLNRPVESHLVEECLQLALQAPTRSNQQQWRCIVVEDANTRAAIGKYYRESWYTLNQSRVNNYEPDDPRSTGLGRLVDSAQYLADHIHEVPVFVIPCLRARIGETTPNRTIASEYASILPAMWSFMLAARARGLGTVYTTAHLAYERECAAVLGIPFDDVTQTGLIPVAYTLGNGFRSASRLPLDHFVSWNTW